MSPATPQRAREEGYQCQDCRLIDAREINEVDYEEFRRRWNDVEEPLTYAELKAGIERRNKIDEERAREWTWPAEPPPDSWQAPTTRDDRAKKLAEHFAETNYHVTAIVNEEIVHAALKRLPQNPELFGQVLAQPHDDAPRSEFAAWLRGQRDLRAEAAADFVEGQLHLAQSLRVDPCSSVTYELAENAFVPRDVNEAWWRYPARLVGALGENVAILEQEGLIADVQWYRGFIEHVTVKAARFLEIADELYSLAPIRHLTITYAKGLDHQDTGLWKALLASPHLARIRSLRLPVRMLENEYTELNRLTGEDLELLAASTHLRGLRYLDLEDERFLPIPAFGALATSPNLPELSHVQYDRYEYGYLGAFTFGNVGPRTRQLTGRPLVRHAAELEARHGYIPWLHPVENYGTEAPDLEAVVEHPVALIKK